MALTFTTPTIWTCPAFVTNVQIECWAAGGGASGNLTATSGSVRGGSGGGGGSYVRKNTYTPVPASIYTIHVGIAGNGGVCSPTTPTNGSDGTHSTFIDPDNNVVSGAAGGHGGVYNGPGGQGGNRADPGAGFSGDDDAHFGGAGYAATTTTYPTLPDGGGGGSSGAFAASGVAASGTVGGVQPDGGNGGDAASATNSAPSSSTLPGGGGGGGSHGIVAGAGANGKIVLTLTYSVAVSDTIATSEVVSRTHESAPTDNVNVGESIFFQVVHPISESLAINEVVLAQQYISVSDSITISENTVVGSFASDSLTIIEEVTGVRVFNETVSDSIGLGESFPGDTQGLSETVTLSETLSGARTKIASDSLVISETVSTAGSVFNLSISDSVVVSEVVINIKTVSGNCLDTFEPDPSLSTRTTTVLSYPVGVSPTMIVSLRNPKFGNKQILQNGREIRYTRGGDQIINDSPYWLNLTFLEMDFESLTQAQAFGLINFLIASAGDEIQLLDWENRTWVGMIVSEPNDVVVQMDSACEYNASFRFEGNLV